MSTTRIGGKPRLQHKRQYRQHHKREPRTSIMSFRLRKTEATLLQADLKTHPIMGINSIKQFARKLILDYINSRLVYVSTTDRKASPDTRKTLISALKPMDYRITDRQFIRALRAFIKNYDNWRKLRYFMLRMGWPARLAYMAKATNSEEKRLRLAQSVLTGMLKPHGHNNSN